MTAVLKRIHFLHRRRRHKKEEEEKEENGISLFFVERNEQKQKRCFI